MASGSTRDNVLTSRLATSPPPRSSAPRSRCRWPAAPAVVPPRVQGRCPAFAVCVCSLAGITPSNVDAVDCAGACLSNRSHTAVGEDGSPPRVGGSRDARHQESYSARRPFRRCRLWLVTRQQQTSCPRRLAAVSGPASCPVTHHLAHTLPAQCHMPIPREYVVAWSCAVGSCVIHDRRPTVHDELRNLLRGAGVECVKLPASSPDLNAYAERFVLSIKFEHRRGRSYFGTGRDRILARHRKLIAQKWTYPRRE
jgi:hypothetical protein